MVHSARSFLDLEFVMNLAQRNESTIIYCDDLETLTAMFWWFYHKLGAASLPVSWLNILHAGLSDEHQRRCIHAACEGKVRILLGSDKIGAGMDFPSVSYVVQYQCRGLTLVRWEQRKGRGARRAGLRAVGIILVEKSMAGEEKGSPTMTAPKSEDPGLLELIQGDGCLQHCVDKRLENPGRGSLAHCPGCSNCDPSLLNITLSFVFMLENPHKPAARASLSVSNTDKIYQDLLRWRCLEWEANWKDKWPGYDVSCLVGTDDLLEIARRAPNISTIDDIDAAAPIPHLYLLGPTLLKAIQVSVRLHIASNSEEEDSSSLAAASNTPDSTQAPVDVRWASPETADTFTAAEAVAEWQKKVGMLSVGETVFQI